MRYQMLPHARPGGMAGLLELLLDKGGRDDIYRLADDLAFEIDDLLPIVDAAQLLGFLKVEEGDAVITESGAEFANSEILRQKELFRDAALQNVLLLRQIRRALEAKSDHTVPEEFFLDMLDEQFSEEESLRQIETAVTWGRYAELFDFDAARRRFVLPDAQEEARRRRVRANDEPQQHPLARTLVTVRKWPFFIDARRGRSAGWRSSSPSSIPPLTGWARPRPWFPSRTPCARCPSTPSIPWCASASPTCSA